MRWTRGVSAVLVAGGLAFPGCSEEPAAREDKGDWEDAGRRAACRYAEGATCGDPSAFSYAGCDLGSLGRVPADGLYTVLYRGDRTPSYFFGGVFRLSGDGSLDVYRGSGPEKQVGADAFFLSNTRQSGVRSYRYSLAGCRAEEGRVYGCYVNCRDGQALTWGTFEAVKWERRAGEGEGSGLERVGELGVEQGLPVDVYVTKGHAYVVSLPRAG
ncbi:MAG TPA: hypothetical protein VLQ93_25455, partial [Myxococcaceae bacterium]|nr:hypothetical protein [Myxococcaceae bacterium]